MKEEYKDKLVMLTGRLSFPKFDELQYSDDDKEKKNGKYSANLIIEAGADISALKKLVQKALKDKFGDKAQAMFKAGKLKVPYKSGAEMVNTEGEIYEGYTEDSTAVPFNFYDPMEFKSRYGENIMSDSKKAETEFYAGCYVKVYVSAHGYDKGNGRGANLRLIGLMKTAEGEAFTSGIKIAADDLFADEQFEEPEFEPGAEKSTPAPEDNNDDW